MAGVDLTDLDNFAAGFPHDLFARHRADAPVWWTTPSPSTRRTATSDVELGGHTIEPGDEVVVWEGSANRDEFAFANAGSFDVTREWTRSNRHTGIRHLPLTFTLTR
jgi:hypothetical protein